MTTLVRQAPPIIRWLGSLIRKVGRQHRQVGMASIIVVTYNNLDSTRLTLESVLAKTRYSHYEVIVVDNGSEPELRDWLAAFAQAHPGRVRLIFNERNLGFPAANNIGILAAGDSEYVVLLNNDCIVTPGWLTGLIRYLRDPRIGMVGPVTNFAGNEACINVDYTRLEDIDRFARRYTSAHRGHSFDIPMLAMFCLAMRRSVVEEIGPLDEQFGAGMFEDDDYARRVRLAGYRIVCAEDVYVHHFGRTSFSKLDQAEFMRIFGENRARFEVKWATTWEPPRPRPEVIVEPWAEHVARYQRMHPPALSTTAAPPSVPVASTARSAIVAAVGAPSRVVHELYHTAIPYEKRLVFWSWRRRNLFALRQSLETWNMPVVRACQRNLRAILGQYPDAKGVVIFPPSVPWYTELFQRPHQMAQAFASLGYVVLYWVEDIDKDDKTVRFRQVAERLHLCKVPPSTFWICPQPIFISYTYNYNWARLLRSPVIVYELIDHLDIFSNFPRRMLQRYHRRLLRQAPVVIGTANDLVAELKPQRPDAILCPNGVDVDHFAVATPETPEDLRPILASGQPIIGYYGALAEWFDFDLVKHAARALPDYQFVLIGPDYDGLTIAQSGIGDVPNIHWLGPKRYDDLPAYLHAFDVATIPFKITEALQAVSPIKLFEYMAGARPIVTTDLAECRKYPVVRIATNREEWVEQLQEGVRLRHDEAYLAALRQTAQENTWRARAQQIIAALEARHPEIASRPSSTQTASAQVVSTSAAQSTSHEG